MLKVEASSTVESFCLYKDDSRRPVGVSWKFAMCLAWDATVVHTFSVSHVIECSSLSIAAAHAAEVLKK